MNNNVFLILTFLSFVFMSGLCAGAETGMYQLSRLRLRLGVEKKRLTFVLLGRCLHDSSGLLLAMLIGTNLANYLGTTIITHIFLAGASTEESAEWFATAVTVPVLFVFGEMIPKNLFFFRADTLMPYVSPFLYTLYRILTWSGIVPALKLISSLFTRLTGLASTSRTMLTSVQRQKVHALLREIHEEGILSSVQSGIVNRLVGISHVRLTEVMVPMHNVETVDVNSDRSALLNKLKKCTFTRLPVVEDQAGNIVGFISIYEVLNLSGDFANLREFLKPVRKLDADMTVTDAIDIMRNDNLKLALVMRATRGKREKTVGILTMKDLVEELLGELAEW